MVNQSAGCGAGGDVAADHLQVGIVLLNPCHAVKHALAVAVSRVDDNYVHAGFNEQFETLFGTGTHADRGACQQLAFAVLGGIGMFGSLDDVFDSNEAQRLKSLSTTSTRSRRFSCINAWLRRGGTFLDGHETIARSHHFAYGASMRDSKRRSRLVTMPRT